MPTTRPTPLAWLNLTHGGRRFLASLAGICFAVVLMFVEFGFWNALLDCTVELVRRLDAGLVMISRAKYTLASAATFNRSRLDRARTLPEVASAVPLYIESCSHVLRVGPEGRETTVKVRVMAFDPAHRVFLLPGVEAVAGPLKDPDTAVVDVLSRGLDPPVVGAVAMLSRRPVRLIGTFQLGYFQRQ